ncbi:unnamed protein product [Phyllotreta striolata]|uniref:Fatty acyl-CoA reductase n=1 Tax=Phyllotreta striolata TaxID=444603 RepID=A0A9N9TUT8_PHYSR|nr:unnamed protein product [Phyllotreta striolata]
MEVNFHRLDAIFKDEGIGNFYGDSEIFITGGTGFVGKALIEKLLRSCPDIRCIYLLMRAKRGRNVDERFRELIENPVFGRLKKEDEGVFRKIRPICGDITHSNLGINKTDLINILEKVNFVFHSAATVKFNEDLKQALIFNTLGTKRVLDFCCNVKNLKSFVYVSTAFSNSIRENIGETVYDTSFNIDNLNSIIDDLSKDSYGIMAKQILGNHPNTYTFTKAVGEEIVEKYSRKIPCAIVRPSIITGSWKEPYPGWVDSVSGITGIFMECGRGTIKSILCNESYKMDIVPVDVVVNTLICAAWHTVQYKSKTMRIYNCISGETNPITWKDFKRLTLKYSKQYPSKYVTWYPGFTYRSSRFRHVICASVFQIIPSVLLDAYLFCVGKPPMMLKISMKFYEALLAGSYFSTNEWTFEVSSMRSLIKAAGAAPDGRSFEMDMDRSSGFCWDSYVKDFNLGVRRYILKDDFESLEKARLKLKRLLWFQKFMQIIPVYLMYRLVYSFLNKWMWQLL